MKLLYYYSRTAVLCSLEKELIESIFPWTIGQRIIINDSRVTSTHVSGSSPNAEDEAGLEFHRGGALTFRGLESTGIIDRPLRLPFDERPCYSIASGYGYYNTNSAYDLAELLKRGRLCFSKVDTTVQWNEKERIDC